MNETVAAFLDECAALDGRVADLDEAGWALATPAEGWTIAHQIAHLAWTDEVAALAATAPEDFAEVVRTAMADPLGYVDEQAAKGADAPPSQLLRRWRTSRETLARALAEAPPEATIPWFGPSMRPRSMATARLMETWAHGQDVVDALGVRAEPTERLRDICHLGVRTRDFAYVINDRPVPDHPFRVELTGPTGDLWTWGEEGTADTVSGTAEDFCLVVTQRREPGDTALLATGEATTWLPIAQAFAGPPKGATR